MNKIFIEKIVAYGIIVILIGTSIAPIMASKHIEQETNDCNYCPQVQQIDATHLEEQLFGLLVQE